MCNCIYIYYRLDEHTSVPVICLILDFYHAQLGFFLEPQTSSLPSETAQPFLSEPRCSSRTPIPHRITPTSRDRTLAHSP